MNVYDAQNPLGPRQFLLRRFITGTADEWSQLSTDGWSSAGSNFDFAGMFRLNNRTYGIDRTIASNVYEIQWSTNVAGQVNKFGSDKLEFTKLVN